MVVALAVGFLWQWYASYKGYNVSATHSISKSLCHSYCVGWHDVGPHNVTCSGTMWPLHWCSLVTTNMTTWFP